MNFLAISLGGGEIMSFEEMKNQPFCHYRLDEWKIKAGESLKGKPIDLLKRSTYENIILKPLYSKEDEKTFSGCPGFSDFRRGINSLGYITNIWKISQRITYKTPEELKRKLETALTSGQTALSFELSKEIFETKDFFENLVIEFYCKYPFAIETKGFQSEMITSLSKMAKSDEDCTKVTGYAGTDLLSSMAVAGKIPDDIVDSFDEWSKTIKKANDKFSNLRTVLVNTSPYHNGGANAVQELGIAAAEGVFYLQHLIESGLELKQVLSKLIFQFSIGSNFFMEIAKLRAARILWNKICEVYGAEEKWRGLHISAETSSFTKTIFDPHVNILRAGNEAFAAVIGGVQYLHVTPFDEMTGSGSFSERIARNTQHILQEETYIQKVIDPAGGSWYIEALTRELAENAWVFFQEIEERGGILAVLKSNWLQKAISAVYEKRKLDVDSRKQSVIGTNVYANLDEAVHIEYERVKDIDSSKHEKMNIVPIPQTRLSKSFETLRVRAEKIKNQTGIPLQIGMICLGTLKQYKTRLDYVSGFLAAGGIKSITSGSINSIDLASEFLAGCKTKHFCLCGSNDQYETFGIELLKKLKATFTDYTFYLAGLPEGEEQSKWIKEGIQQFIHANSNCYETISSILSEMEESLYEQPQA